MTTSSKHMARRKVALVTGASGGIGQATARALAKAGYTVFGTSRRQAAGSALGGIRMLSLDVTSDSSVAEAMATIEAEAGGIDLLVNNAGVGLMGAAEEISLAQVHELFETNVYGLMRMTNAVLPIMRRQRSGRIVNLSSIMGLIPAPFSAHYAATKHAVEGYSESLDHEVRDFGIRVVLIEPGMTRSAFESNVGRGDRSIADYKKGLADVSGWFAEGMKAADTPESVAEKILIAAEAKDPKLRYATGKGTGLIALLRRFVPSSAFDKSVRKQMRLA